MAQAVRTMGELVERRKWEKTGEPRENPLTGCLSTTKPRWHELGSNRGVQGPEVSALPLIHSQCSTMKFGFPGTLYKIDQVQLNSLNREDLR